MMFLMRKSGLIVMAMAALVVASLAGCGQFGPLYLPDRPPPRDQAQDSEFNAQPPTLDKSRQP